LSKQHAIAPLLETGEAALVKPSFTRNELLDIVSARLQQIGNTRLKSPKFIEWTPRFLLRFRSTDGTSLAPAVEALADAGVDIEPNLYSVMETLQVSQSSLHSLACGCHHENGVTSGVQLARDFETAKYWEPYR